MQNMTFAGPRRAGRDPQQPWIPSLSALEVLLSEEGTTTSEAAVPGAEMFPSSLCPISPGTQFLFWLVKTCDIYPFLAK